MTSPVEGAYVIKDGTVSVNGTAYGNQVQRARLVPDQPVQTYRTLVPNGAAVDVDSPTWTFDLAGLQVNRTGGLAAALRALEAGEEADIILIPHNRDGEIQAAFTILALAPPFGGERGSWATMEMVFPVKGQPVFTAVDLTP